MELERYNEEYINYLKEIVKEKHKGQTRKQGTPYYLHPFTVAQILKDKGFNEKYQITGLFHDLLEDTDTTSKFIVDISDLEIANAVELLTKKEGYNMISYINGIKQNEIAKMVKLVDRIHNLSETHYASNQFKEKYIKETEDWYIELSKGTIFERELNFILQQLKDNL